MGVPRLAARPALVGLAVLLLLGCGKEPVKPALPAVKARDLRLETISLGTRFSASVKPRVSMDLSFKVAGTVLSLHAVKTPSATRDVQAGDMLAKGTVIAQLETRDYEQARASAEAALGQAEASVKQTQAGVGQAQALGKQAEAGLLQAKAKLESVALELKLAEQNWTRYQEMSPETISEKEREDAMARRDQAAAEHAAMEQQVRVAEQQVHASSQQVLAAQQQARAAELQVASAKVALAAAQDRLADCSLQVPFEGATVAQVLVQTGERVAAGVPAFKLIDMSTVHVAFGVPDIMLGEPATGDSIRIGDRLDVAADAFPAERFTGTVTRIAPIADANTRTFLTELSLENPKGPQHPQGRLRPGMIVRIRVKKDAQALLLPMTAVQRGAAPGEMVVYVVTGPDTGAQVSRRRVVLGGLYDNQVEVLAGSEVREGDRIVTAGASLVNEGQSVRVILEVEERTLE
ncbi:MAG: efflux RND transporter periplasmic adaptor subunit [Planctomycetota bacterium]